MAIGLQTEEIKTPDPACVSQNGINTPNFVLFIPIHEVQHVGKK